jgi:hypothetical protein
MDKIKNQIAKLQLLGYLVFNQEFAQIFRLCNAFLKTLNSPELNTSGILENYIMKILSYKIRVVKLHTLTFLYLNSEYNLQY